MKLLAALVWRWMESVASAETLFWIPMKLRRQIVKVVTAIGVML
jgi:hypothetical protein